MSEKGKNSRKKRKKLTWKDVYQKCNHHEISQVTNVYDTFSLKSNLKNLLKNYGVPILTVTIIIIIILIITFWKTIGTMLIALVLLLALAIFAIIYATYEIKLDKDGVRFKINFQETFIPYNKLIGIYLERAHKRFFFIPIHYYVLKITEYVDKEKMNIYSFPTIMLNKKKTIDFFKCFDVNVLKDAEEEEEKADEAKKILFKAIGILLIVLIVIALIVSFIMYLFNR